MDIDMDLVKSLGSAVVVVGPAIGWLWRRIDKRIKDCDAQRDVLSERVAALEAANGCDFPQWIRDADGRFISVNVAFMRVAATPIGYKRAELIGQRFEDLARFDAGVVAQLKALDQRALAHGFACAHGFELYPGQRFSIHKAIGESTDGEVVFIGELVPETP